MAVKIHRWRTTARFLDQVVEEARDHVDERLGVVGPARPFECRYHHRQHLLYRTTDLLGHGSRRVDGVVGRDAVGDEGIYVRRQVARDTGTAGPSELAEGEADRNAAPDRLGPVTMLCQPGYGCLDLGPDPGPAKPIDGRRLEEVLLQHGTTSVQRMNWRTNIPETACVMWPNCPSWS